MSRQLSILIITIFTFVNSYANAGDDGKLKLNENKNGYVEVGDCFEKVNRGIFAFNQVLDKVIFKPLAKGYRMFPQPIRSGTSNALSNLGNVVTIPNNVLQGQFKDAGLNSARFVINSTLGIAGIFDVASYYGLKITLSNTWLNAKIPLLTFSKQSPTSTYPFLFSFNLSLPSSPAFA